MLLSSFDRHALCKCWICDQSQLTVKAALICDIVDQQDAHGASIVCSCDCTETLLTCSIPYLQFHSLPVELNSSDLKVDADGGNERGCKRVLAEP